MLGNNKTFLIEHNFIQGKFLDAYIGRLWYFWYTVNEQYGFLFSGSVLMKMIVFTLAKTKHLSVSDLDTPLYINLMAKNVNNGHKITY